MFTGVHEHTIDKKGRTSLPARYRAELARGAYITVGIDKNLVIYPIEYFEQLAKELSKFPFADPIARKFRRRIFNKAEFVEFDANGRFLIPNYLRDEFQFGDGDKIIFAGSDEYIEIWTAEGWRQAEEETFEDEATNAQFAQLFDRQTF